jgi:hypothetical protein
MRNFCIRFCRENQNTLTIFNFFFKNLAVYEIMWNYFEQPDRPYMTVWRMRILRWIPNTTNTNLQYVILPEFPLEEWLHESVPVLRSLPVWLLFLLNCYAFFGRSQHHGFC